MRALAALGGTLGGAGIGSAFGYTNRGAQIGGIAGDLIGGGIQDVLNGASAWHVAGQTAAAGGLMTAAGGAAYGLTGSMDSALFWANMAGLPSNMIARRLVPCFAAGTPVLTPEGDKPIEQLRAGDIVLSRDEASVHGPVEGKLVEELFVREGVILELTICGRVIRTTKEHPFYVQDRGWTAAGDLKIGDLLATRDCRWLRVDNLADTARVETVYNLRVADFHTYFVGSGAWGFGVWAHNRYTGFDGLPLASKLSTCKKEVFPAHAGSRVACVQKRRGRDSTHSERWPTTEVDG